MGAIYPTSIHQWCFFDFPASLFREALRKRDSEEVIDLYPIL